MPIQVIKKNGKAEPFHRQKIVDSCTKAGAPPDVAASIADDIQKTARDQMPTSEIRVLVLDRLGRMKPEWRKNWEQYEATKKK